MYSRGMTVPAPAAAGGRPRVSLVLPGGRPGPGGGGGGGGGGLKKLVMLKPLTLASAGFHRAFGGIRAGRRAPTPFG